MGLIIDKLQKNSNISVHNIHKTKQCFLCKAYYNGIDVNICYQCKKTLVSFPKSPSLSFSTQNSVSLTAMMDEQEK